MCKKEFSPKRSKQLFCSRACGALYASSKVDYINRKHKEKTKKCKKCGELILKRQTYCHSCVTKGYNNEHLKNRTIDQITYKDKGSNRYAVIRDQAKRITNKRTQVCCKCGYNKHVETCHIKDIGEFSKDSKLEEVNNPSNLILLCPNCHWEFDHDLSTLDSLKLVGDADSATATSGL